MPYKCSVKGCRSNYDSTAEKVSVFRLPTDPDLKTNWLNNLRMNSSISTNSRVCVKHFEPEDVIKRKEKCMLKSDAVPKSGLTENSRIEFPIEFPEEIEGDSSESEIEGFRELLEGIQLMQSKITEHWNICSFEDGVCFYRLSCTDEKFGDVFMSFKVLINSRLQIKVFKNDREASNNELKEIVDDCRLIKWTQLEFLLDSYKDEPEILVKKQPVNDLKKILEMLDGIQEVELQQDISEVRERLQKLLLNARLLPEEEDLYCQLPCSKAEFLDIEALQEPDFEKDPQQEEDSQEIEALEEYSETDYIEYDPFKCKNCHMIYKSESGYQNHKKSCKASSPNSVSFKKNQKPNQWHICDICGKTFSAKKGLREHLKIHSPKYRKKCPYCDVTFFMGVLRRHIKSRHLKLKEHQCSICNKAFSTRSQCTEHEKIHNKHTNIQQYLVTHEGSPKYSCPKCLALYTTSSLLKIHMESNCRQAQKKRLYRYPCNECSRNFLTKIQAAQHMTEIHSVNITNVDKFCFECSKEFDDYVNHVRGHSCKFACNFCGAKFLTQEKVTKHEESKHSGETLKDRPFKCLEDNCGLSFKNVNHLRSHQQSFHIKQDKEFQCVQCNKKFGLKAHLTIHARKHFTSFSCNFVDCKRNFKKLNSLKEHFERDHGTLDIYLCGIEGCDLRFKLLNLLKHHRESEHGLNFNMHKYFGS